jgi:hypothetical protein
MSEKERQKKDHHRKDKERQAMRESSSPRKEQASVRYGEQERSNDDGRRRGDRIDFVDPEKQ